MKDKRFFLISIWATIGALVFFVPIYWAIAYKWTDAGARIDYVWEYYSGTGVNVGIVVVVPVLLFAFFLAWVFVLIFDHAFVAAFMLLGLTAHTVIRLPIFGALVASSCDAVHVGSEETFSHCSAIDADLVKLGYYFDYVLFALYGVIALGIATWYHLC